jgi:biotin-dependent carboxylase-like uncharacterized protein
VARLRVLRPGLLTSVQDLGRPGFAHLGVSRGGAADPLALRVGNRLLGNHDGAAGLELTLLGPDLLVEDGAVVALTGSACVARLDGALLPAWRPVEAPAGAHLEIGPLTGGARATLCVRGGISVPGVLGSAATDLRAGFGGLEGRALRTGDVLVSGEPRGDVRPVDASSLLPLLERHELRVTRGPQAAWLGAEALQGLLAQSYEVQESSNRLGIRLSGEALMLPERLELLTEGASLGAVQFPPDGQPIILFVEQQTTGGYPKAANVISADFQRLGQLRPRDHLRFVEVDIPAARSALRLQEAQLDAVLGPAR